MYEPKPKNKTLFLFLLIVLLSLRLQRCAYKFWINVNLYFKEFNVGIHVFVFVDYAILDAQMGIAYFLFDYLSQIAGYVDVYTATENSK